MNPLLSIALRAHLVLGSVAVSLACLPCLGLETLVEWIMPRLDALQLRDLYFVGNLIAGLIVYLFIQHKAREAFERALGPEAVTKLSWFSESTIVETSPQGWLVQLHMELHGCAIP